MAFTVTVTQVDQQTYASVSRAVRGSEVANLRPSTEGNLSSAAIFEKWSGTAWQTWYVSQTYASVLSSMTADEAESGAELQTNKDATGGYAGLTLYKLNLVNNAATYTSTLANTNTAARAYTLPDVSGGVLVGAKIATGALVAGVRTVTVTGASTSSTAVVMTVALGGTVAAGGYKVACTADTVTITALQADGTTTETACTSTVQGICIL